MFSLLGLRFVPLSTWFWRTTVRAQRIIGFFCLNYPQINGVRKSDLWDNWVWVRVCSWHLGLFLFLFLFFLTTGHIHRAETALIRGLKLAVEARDEETRAMIESDLIKLDINIQWKVWFNLSASWMFYSCFPFTLLLCLLSALLLSNSSPLHSFLFLPVLIFSSSSSISASVHLFPLRIQFALPSPPFLSVSPPLLPFSLFSSLSLFSFVSSLSFSLSSHPLRGSFTKLSLPLPKTNYGKRWFSYKGAYLWNRLPEDMRNSESISVLKNKLKRLPPSFFDSL